jgi:hypothetical protein
MLCSVIVRPLILKLKVRRDKDINAKITDLMSFVRFVHTTCLSLFQSFAVGTENFHGF